MAVQSDTSRISYAGNNSTSTSYAVPFVFLENSHLKAIAKTSAGVETVVTLTNHTGAGDVNGGTVRTAVAVPAASTLTIYRDVPLTQTTTYAEGGDFPAASHERALDKLTTITQQLDRRINTCVRGSEATPLSPLPSPIGTQQFVLATTANQAPAWQPQSAIAIGPVIATGSSEPRFVSDRFGDVINVKDFGAVGDGTADDTAAIQAAIDAASPTTSWDTIFNSSNFVSYGKTVYLPKGTYRLTSRINVWNGVNLVGDGKSSTMLSFVTPSGGVTYKQTLANGQSGGQNSNYNGRFTIHGNNQTTGVLLELINFLSGTFEDVLVEYSLGVGMLLNNVQNSLFNNLYLAANGNTGIANCVASAATDTITKTAHGLNNNDIIQFTVLTGGTGLDLDKEYYVVNATANTLQVSSRRGGTATDITGDYSALTVITGANIIISGASSYNHFVKCEIHSPAFNNVRIDQTYTGGQFFELLEKNIFEATIFEYAKGSFAGSAYTPTAILPTYQSHIHVNGANCNIVLCNSNIAGNNIVNTGINTARNVPNVRVVTGSVQWSDSQNNGDAGNLTPVTPLARGFKIGVPKQTGTASATGDWINCAGHRLLDDYIVLFDALVGGTGLSTFTNYYVVQSTADQFKVSLTKGGTPIDITGDYSSVSFVVQLRAQVNIGGTNNDTANLHTLFETHGYNSFVNVTANSFWRGNASIANITSSDVSRTESDIVANISEAAIDLKSGQIKFPATALLSSSANTLDDYEEGEFTPVLLSNGSGTGITMAAAPFTGGAYVKIGSLVFINVYLAATVNTGTISAGGVTIGGLPNFGSFGAEGAAFTVAKYFGLTNGTTLTAQHNGTTGISLFASQIDATTQAGNTALAHTVLGASVGIYLSGFFMASRS